jgi:hypothetical protein
LIQTAKDVSHTPDKPSFGWVGSYLSFIFTEANMAKRRNLKKEKAERNQAYARKFRKRPTGGRMFKSRFRPQSNGTSAEEDNEDTSAAAT